MQQSNIEIDDIYQIHVGVNWCTMLANIIRTPDRWFLA